LRFGPGRARQHRTVAVLKLPAPGPELPLTSPFHPSPFFLSAARKRPVPHRIDYYFFHLSSHLRFCFRLHFRLANPPLFACFQANGARAVRSTDWHLPSPSSTPKSATFPDAALKTPKTEAFPQSHFLDAWSTPRVNGHQTPAQTPSFILSTPIERPSTAHSQALRTPEDPEFHVNYLAASNLPLPPVEPARRLSSSPDPHLARPSGVTLREHPSTRPRPHSMDTSQMQTPPPTRDATSRRSFQQNAGQEFSTPATVIARTPGQMPPSGLFNQTPFGFSSLQFSPDMLQFQNTGPMSAPPLPHSRLFWDQPNDGSQMDVDMPLASDPFGPTPHKFDGNMNWPTFHTPVNNQMHSQTFQGLHGMSSPGPGPSFSTSNAGDGNSRSNSFVSTSAGVDPSMLFSFSSPGPTTTSFDSLAQIVQKPVDNRQPYETQLRDSMREREMAKKAKGQHSRTSTNSSSASFEPAKHGLQRSNTDSGFRKSRPSSMESRSSGGPPAFNVPRRSSPLKRQSNGSLLAIPEVRRPKTRLIIDETGRARTETVPADEDDGLSVGAESQADLRRQYPGLWADDESDSEAEEPGTLSRNTSFNMPQQRPSKHGRSDSNELTRSHSFKVPRPSRPSSGGFDKASFETIRPQRRLADNAHRRFSMMDFPTSFSDIKENEHQIMPDSPGDALGALKKVVEGRQKRVGMAINQCVLPVPG
jgi:hypothetical protein